jgi:hypothetical protein
MAYRGEPHMTDSHRRKLDRARHALYTLRERYETSDGAKISGIWGKGLYQSEYDRLNRKYFSGKLPAYNTQLGYIETGTAVDYFRTGAQGHFDPERRRITLSQLGEAVARHHGSRKLKTWVRQTLLREMCRIAGRGDRRAYLRELKRLADLGEQWVAEEIAGTERPVSRSGAA